MKKLVCTLIIFATLVSLCACKNSGKDTKDTEDIKETCAHNWNSNSGICTICGDACSHLWDKSSEYCKICGISCLTILKKHIQTSPDYIENGNSLKTRTIDGKSLSFSTTSSTDSKNITAIQVRSSEIVSESLEGYTWDITFTFFINQQLTKLYSFDCSIATLYQGSTEFTVSLKGLFDPSKTESSSRLTSYTFSSDTEIEDQLRPYWIKSCVNKGYNLSNLVCPMLDTYLREENLGFTATNLGLAH